MKNFLYIGAMAILIFSIFISILTYKEYLKQNDLKNQIIYEDLGKAVGIIKSQKDIPLPGGTVIYYNKDGKLVKEGEQYDIVSGWLCGKQFQNIGINIKEPFHDKCYKYSVTNDKKNFQIAAAILEGNSYKTYLTGESQFSITKDYINDTLISQNDTDKFPYNPYTKFLSAKIIGLSLSGGKLIIMDENSKSTILDEKNYKDYTIKPFETIILRGGASAAYIKFENQDILKLKGDTIVKISENEMYDETAHTNIFWLIGSINYNMYSSNGDSKIQNPSQTMGIRGDIFEGAAKMEGNKYSVYTKFNDKEKDISIKNNFYHIKNAPNIEKILEGDTSNGLGADIYGGNNKFKIENIIEIEK